MLKTYCPNCNESVNYTVKKNLIEEYKGSEVNVEENIANCDKCNENIFIEALEEDNLNRLYNKYREVEDIIKPDEIAGFRDEYNISQRELCAIMNWGKMTVNRYERGSLPSPGHADLLNIIINDEMFLKEKLKDALYKERINTKTYDKVNKKLKDDTDDIYKQCVISDLTHREDEYNGFRSFDIDRLTNLISYLADEVTLYKTSLNKYLWYIDFENFKHNIRSITGTRYMKYEYGPVIEDFKYEEIINNFNDKFYKNEIEEDCRITTTIISKQNYDLSVFKKSELEVIDSVIEEFKDISCSDISRLSHEENGWIDNNSRELISYNYAEKLKVDFIEDKAL